MFNGKRYKIEEKEKVEEFDTSAHHSTLLKEYPQGMTDSCVSTIKTILNFYRSLTFFGKILFFIPIIYLITKTVKQHI